MKQKLDDILDECVEAIINREKTLEECLNSYQEVRAELESLLRAALKLRDVDRISPDIERKRRARERLLAAVEQKAWEMGVERKPVVGALKQAPRTTFWRRPVAKLGVVTLAFAVLSSGTMVMAKESLPGSPLYPIKLAVENTRVEMAGSGEKKAGLYLDYATERVDEIEALDRNDKKYPALVSAVARNIAAAQVAAGENPKFVATLNDLSRKNRVVLEAVLEIVPESARPAIQRALSKGKEENKNGTSSNDIKTGDDKKRPGSGETLDRRQDEPNEGRPASELEQPGLKKPKDSKGSPATDNGIGSQDKSSSRQEPGSPVGVTARASAPGTNTLSQKKSDDAGATDGDDKFRSSEDSDDDNRNSHSTGLRRVNSCMSCKNMSPAIK